ncbi:MBL fold metallo-hydrolase [Allosphingosinicella indica]|uniref:Glyoxylase, beta-lactamase superfamily II n=1 Tax=Allosphingosinicella indica TaxID=941907 RepID=A0A1X7G3I5_9SPHN|nr:MBL fold metallo-hydrolase [Allosphingosinicella indica]SMF62576.1 Glyoxylase, beta-lactamase superfamily II [Allosphingosinicella indica]
MRIALLALLLAGCAADAATPTWTLIPGGFDAGRQPDGNSVLIDAPQGLILVDTGRHAAHQAKILAAARGAGKPVAAIVNTHWHLDHSGGNAEIRAAFPGIPLYASRAVEGALDGFLADSRRDALAYIASGKADAATEAEIRADIAASEDRGALVPDHPVEASGESAIAGRTIDLRLARNAATAGDVWLYLPEDHTVIVGDIVTLPVPFLDTASAGGWLAALDHVAATPFETLIPGHGPAMDRAAFARWHGAFRNLVACADGEASDGDCAAGWRRDLGPLLPAADANRADRMIAYYLTARLRPGSPGRAKPEARPAKD